MPTNQYGDLTIKAITKAHSVAEAISIVNFNFEQILLKGGGPEGQQGSTGGTGTPGASINGPQGLTGPSGASIYFSAAAIDDGDPILDTNILAGDIIIDPDGNFFEALVGVDGDLIYQFRLNIVAAITDQRLVNYLEYLATSAAVATVNYYDASDNDRNTLFLVRKIIDTGITGNVYRKLVLGDVNTVILDNTPLMLVNLIKDDEVDATDSDYRQLVLKHRPNKTDGTSITSFGIKHEGSNAGSITSLISDSVKLDMITDIVDPDNNLLRIKAKTVIMNGDSDSIAPDNYVSYNISGTESWLQSPKYIRIFAGRIFAGQAIQTWEPMRLDNNLTFEGTLFDTGSNHYNLEITLPSDKTYSVVNSLAGGMEGQLVTLRNLDTTTVILDDSGNLLMRQRVVNLATGEIISFIKENGSWREIYTSTPEYAVTKLDAAFINYDLDNLDFSGIYQLILNSDLDPLDGELDGSVDVIDIGIDPVTPVIPVVTTTIANHPSFLNVYATIFKVIREYPHGMVAQEGQDLNKGYTIKRFRDIDDVWIDWSRVAKYGKDSGQWMRMIESDANYNYTDYSVNDHSFAYTIYNGNTLYFRFSAIIEVVDITMVVVRVDYPSGLLGSNLQTGYAAISRAIITRIADGSKEYVDCEYQTNVSDIEIRFFETQTLLVGDTIQYSYEGAMPLFNIGVY
jgi:hypothetical protein